MLAVKKPLGSNIYDIPDDMFVHINIFLTKLHLICINFSSPDTLYTLNCHPIQKQENDFVSQSRFYNKFNLPFAFQFQPYIRCAESLKIPSSLVLSIVVDFELLPWLLWNPLHFRGLW